MLPRTLKTKLDLGKIKSNFVLPKSNFVFRIRSFVFGVSVRDVVVSVYWVIFLTHQRWILSPQNLKTSEPQTPLRFFFSKIN